MESLSLVVPACNEADNIVACVQQARRALDEVGGDWEIVVVDDGSTDRTWALLEELRAEGRLVALRHDRNRGYGAALRTGFGAARGRWVVFTDADLQLDLAELPRLLALADRHEIVAGYRAHRSDPLHRRLNAQAWGWLVRALYDVPVRDVNCAFKVIDRRVLEAVPLRSSGAVVNTELLVRARAAGFRVAEVPVAHRPRRAGRASGARPDVVLRALGELLALHAELRPPGRRAVGEPLTARSPAG